MTVAELIAHLQTLPVGLEIYFAHGNWGGPDEPVDAEDFEVFRGTGKEDVLLLSGPQYGNLDY